MDQLNFLKDIKMLKLAIVFGSAASETLRADSDLDIAVHAGQPLNSDQIQSLVNEISMATGRPVDLIDLSRTHGVLLRQILHRGRLLFCRDTTLLGDLTSQLLAWQEDFEPTLNAMLKARINRLIRL